ncbi:MAG: phosphate ABC transporter permease PstA [Firmicutes bacterium]|jgi:phosphate transport system permease protein|nr:phosphate ABC transporter permease PstA [Bacillota bacterium]
MANRGFRQKIREYRRSPVSAVLYMLVWLSMAITLAVLASLIAYIVYNGVPNLTLPGLFDWEYNSENVSMMPAIINTVIMTGLSLALAVPMGVFAAIYLVEYARRGNRLVKIVRITAETLAGIPSIVYGLFGYVLFVITLGWGYTLLSGAITLAIMILPLIMRTTEEALISVPDSFREGSFGLGAGKLRTVFKIVLPSASPGILAGTILAIGRIVGESAALIFTAGTNPVVPDSLFASTRTLSVHMYALMNEGLYTPQAYATAVVLLIVVVLINSLSGVVAKKLVNRR